MELRLDVDQHVKSAAAKAASAADPRLDGKRCRKSDMIHQRNSRAISHPSKVRKNPGFIRRGFWTLGCRKREEKIGIQAGARKRTCVHADCGGAAMYFRANKRPHLHRPPS
jgi:hypothetical protein